MLDKKQTQVIFLLKLKIGHKAAKTTLNINNAFGPGTANKHSAVVFQEVLQRRLAPWKWRA